MKQKNDGFNAARLARAAQRRARKCARNLYLLARGGFRIYTRKEG